MIRLAKLMDRNNRLFAKWNDVSVYVVMRILRRRVFVPYAKYHVESLMRNFLNVLCEIIYDIRKRLDDDILKYISSFIYIGSFTFLF